MPFSISGQYCALMDWCGSEALTVSEVYTRSQKATGLDGPIQSIEIRRGGGGRLSERRHQPIMSRCHSIILKPYLTFSSPYLPPPGIFRSLSPLMSGHSHDELGVNSVAGRTLRSHLYFKGIIF